MAIAILVVPTEPRVGLTTVALGLVHALDRKGIPVGFCKPIGQPHATDTGPERSTRLARAVTSLNPPEPMSAAEAENLLGHDRENILLEEVIARYERAAQKASVVVVEGLVDTEERSYGTHLNAKMAQSWMPGSSSSPLPAATIRARLPNWWKWWPRPTAASATNG